MGGVAGRRVPALAVAAPMSRSYRYVQEFVSQTMPRREHTWTHLLAYNLIRTIVAQAASQIDIPRSVSFKATIQILEAFQPVIAYQGHWGIQYRQELYQQLLKAIATHRVADRPDRFEPRMTKRRPINYDRLTRPRREIKREMIKRFSEN
jgi:hypothetical protein